MFLIKTFSAGWFSIRSIPYEELASEIKSRYPNLKVFTLRSVKGFVITKSVVITKESGKEFQSRMETARYRSVIRSIRGEDVETYVGITAIFFFYDNLNCFQFAMFYFPTGAVVKLCLYDNTSFVRKGNKEFEIRFPNSMQKWKFTSVF